jgi:hypothetical protein
MESQSVQFALPKVPTKAVTGVVTRLFGCWHVHMSVPITSGRETYRACLDCGARRPFDTRNWRVYGRYYFEK